MKCSPNTSFIIDLMVETKGNYWLKLISQWFLFCFILF